VSVTVYFVDSSVRIWDDKSLEDGKNSSPTTSGPRVRWKCW